jgi:hypothetical protein
VSWAETPVKKIKANVNKLNLNLIVVVWIAPTIYDWKGKAFAKTVLKFNKALCL